MLSLTFAQVYLGHFLLAPPFLPGSTFTTVRDRGRSLSFRSLAHIATGADEDFSGDLSAGRKKVLSLHRGRRQSPVQTLLLSS